MHKSKVDRPWWGGQCYAICDAPPVDNPAFGKHNSKILILVGQPRHLHACIACPQRWACGEPSVDHVTLTRTIVVPDYAAYLSRFAADALNPLVITNC